MWSTLLVYKKGYNANTIIPDNRERGQELLAVCFFEV